MSEPTDELDPELIAIGKALVAIRPLSESARGRALAYITERLATEAAAGNGSGT